MGHLTDAGLQVLIREGAHFAVADDASLIQSATNRNCSAHSSQICGSRGISIEDPRIKLFDVGLKFSRRIAIRA